MVNNVTKIHAPSLEFPAKYKGRTGSSIRKLICHPSLWNNNNRTEIDFGLFFNIYQYTRFHTDIWRGRERLNDVFHTLNKLTWHNTAGDGGGDRDGGWHRGEQEGRLTSRPQLDLQYGHTLSSFTEHDDLPIVLHSDLLGGVVLVDVADMDTHHKQN